VQALEQSWFAAAERDSEAADELEALEVRPQPEFTRLKVALACIAAAFAMLLMPVLKPSPKPALAKAPAAAAVHPPALVAMAGAPAKVKKPAAKVKQRGAAKPSRRRH
jgi:hypothetical protein